MDAKIDDVAAEAMRRMQEAMQQLINGQIRVEPCTVRDDHGSIVVMAGALCEAEARMIEAQIMRVMGDPEDFRVVVDRRHDFMASRCLKYSLVPVPEREQLLYKSPEAMRALSEGIESAKTGPLVDLGSFAEFADDE